MNDSDTSIADRLPDRLQDDVERLYPGAGYPTAEQFVEAAVSQHIRRTLKRYPHLDTEYRYRTHPPRSSAAPADGDRCFKCSAPDVPLHERVIEIGQALHIVKCCGCWQPKVGPHPAEARMLAALGSVVEVADGR